MLNAYLQERKKRKRKKLGMANEQAVKVADRFKTNPEQEAPKKSAGGA